MKAAVLFIALALPAATLSAQSVTGAKRLVSQAFYVNSAGGYRLQDSAHYSYSGQRSSRFDQNYLFYNELQQMGSSPDANFAEMRIATNNIDSSILPHADYDSAFFAISIGSAAPNAMQQQEGHRYGPAGEITQVFNRVFDPGSGTQQFGQQSIQIYNSGRLTRSYIFGFNGVKYDSSFIRDYKYNGAGQVILDSLSFRLSAGSYQGYRKMVYSYGGAGGVSSIVLFATRLAPVRLEPSNRLNIDYYPDGRLKHRTWFFMGDAGNFLPIYKDSFGYTPGVMGFSYLREDDLDTLGNSLYTYYTLTSRVNSRGQKDSMTFPSFQGTTPLRVNRVAIVYDTAGYPLSRSDYYSSTGAAPFSIENYSYEPIPQIAAGIAALRPEPTLTLAPNPCRESLTYTLENTAIGSNICIEVLDIRGQLVHRELRNWNGAPAQLVLGPEAPAGQYMLRVSDIRAGTRSSRQFTRL
jgi:hypothetical protein